MASHQAVVASEASVTSPPHRRFFLAIGSSDTVWASIVKNCPPNLSNVARRKAAFREERYKRFLGKVGTMLVNELPAYLFAYDKSFRSALQNRRTNFSDRRSLHHCRYKFAWLTKMLEYMATDRSNLPICLHTSPCNNRRQSGHWKVCHHQARACSLDPKLTPQIITTIADNARKSPFPPPISTICLLRKPLRRDQLV